MKKITILALHLGYGGIENCISNLANSLVDDYEVNIILILLFAFIYYILYLHIMCIIYYSAYICILKIDYLVYSVSSLDNGTMV